MYNATAEYLHEGLLAVARELSQVKRMHIVYLFLIVVCFCFRLELILSVVATFLDFWHVLRVLSHCSFVVV